MNIFAIDECRAPRESPKPAQAEGTPITRQQAAELWGSSESFGDHSEKASKQGWMGLGVDRLPNGRNVTTVADGGPVVLTVAPLHVEGNKFSSQPTRAMVLDADAIRRANGGEWPADAATLKQIIQRNPCCVVADVEAKQPPETFRIDGVKPGTRLVVLAGAEGLNGERPAPSQVNVLNASTIPDDLKNIIPANGIRAGSTRLPLNDRPPFIPADHGDRHEKGPRRQERPSESLPVDWQWLLAALEGDAHGDALDLIAKLLQGATR